MEGEWERQKEARVIGRRGRTSEGEHLPCTRSPRSRRRSIASQLPQMFPRGPKKIVRKKERARRRTGTVERKEKTRIMNTYACTYRGGTSFTASGRSGREGGHDANDSRAMVRHHRADVPAVAEIIVRSSSVVSTPFFAGDGCTLLNLVLCTDVPSRASMRARDSCF